MADDEIKEKFRKAREAEESEEQEKKRIVSETQQKYDQLRNNIIKQIAELESQLPENPDIIDEKAFVAFHGLSLCLIKKKSEIYVRAVRGRIIEAEQKVAFFMETFAASYEVLLKLNERIPEFRAYLGTKY